MVTVILPGGPQDTAFRALTLNLYLLRGSRPLALKLVSVVLVIFMFPESCT